jgi:hypothetical protein
MKSKKNGRRIKKGSCYRGMAFMIAENKEGRIANQDWRLAFFVLVLTPGKHF